MKNKRIKALLWFTVMAIALCSLSACKDGGSSFAPLPASSEEIPDTIVGQSSQGEQESETAPVSSILPSSQEEPVSPYRTTVACTLSYDALSKAEQAFYARIDEAAYRLMVSIRAEDVKKERLSDVLAAYRSDHPEAFWLTGNLQYTTHSSGRFTVYLQYMTSFDYSAKVQKGGDESALREKARTEIQAQIGELNQAVNEAFSGLSLNMPVYDMELRLHDWLVNRCQYDTAAAAQPSGYPSAFTAYGALVQGRAVCEGYSRAMQLLLLRGGIPASVISGTAQSGGQTISHMWNLVQLDNTWYHLDPTFDDPQGEDYLIYDYFNLTDELIRRDHTVSGNLFTPPACSATAYHYYSREGLSFPVFSEYMVQFLSEKLVSSCQAGRRVYSIQFGGKPEDFKAFRQAVMSRGNAISQNVSRGLSRTVTLKYFYQDIFNTFHLVVEG